jgi:putative MATE family efflux protein
MNEEFTEKDSLDHQEMARREVPGMFDGPVLPLLTRLSLPIFAGMVFQLLYNIVDTIWVSRIDLNDPSFVGGTGLIFPVIFFFMALAAGLSVGISSLVARAIGEKNRKVLDETADSGMAVALVLSAASMIVVYLWGPQIVRAMGAEGDYYTHGLNYLLYIAPVALFAFVQNIFFGIFQGEGQMKHVMVSMIIGTVANIVLDPIFIFLLNLDVRGAAIATGLAQLLSLSYCLWVFGTKKTLVPISWSIKKVRWINIKKIITIGFPQSLGQITMSVAFLLLNRLVVSIDPLALTAFSLAGRMDQVVLMPSFAIAAALITIVGQNAGRGLMDRVARVVRVGYAAGFTVVFILATLMVVLARFIYPFFSGIDEVVRYAVLQTYVLEYTFCFAVVGILNRSFFQAIGYPLPALFITLLRVLLVSVPAAYLFARGFNLGMYGVWFGLATGSLTSLVVSFFWVRVFLKKLQAGTLEIRHA